MQLGEISFCDRIGFNIKSDEVKKKLLDDLETATQFKVIQKHYERFNQTQVNKINTIPHMVSVRTNGNPYLLYLTKCNFQNQVLFIDKKIQHGYFYPRIIMSKLWFDSSLFNNTLFDGEMVKTTTGEWHFIISDIICYNSELLAKMNLHRRMQLVNTILESKYKPDEMNCCQLFTKRYFRVTQVQDMIEKFIPCLPYSCRGIYFKPFHLKFRDILYNFDESVIRPVTRTKLKHTSDSVFLLQANLTTKNEAEKISTQPVHQTIKVDSEVTNIADRTNFLVRKTGTPDVFELFAMTNTNKLEGHALVNNIETSKMMRDAFRLCNVNDKLCFRCTFNEKFKKWKPLELLVGG